MPEVEVHVTSIEGSRLSEEATEDSQVLFNVDVSMSEAERKADSLLLNFTIKLEPEPVVGKLSVTGTAQLNGKQEEIEELLRTPDENSVPQVFMRIYQKVYSMMYLLCASLDLPYPSPGLLKLTHMESTRPIPQQAR